MPGTRDHEPFVIEDFGGWWNRGDPETAPSDHFTQAENIHYVQSGCETRPGLTKYLNNPEPILRAMRMYNYVTLNGASLLVSTLDAANMGRIFHITGPDTIPTTPILSVDGMEDFGFVAINGRAYITPFRGYENAQGEPYHLGIKNEFLYVYKGDGTPARKAGGLPPVGTLTVGLGVSTAPNFVTDTGLHLFGVAYETDTGYITAPAGFTSFNITTGQNEIAISGIPISPSSFVKKRHLVATKEIVGYNGDLTGYQYFFIPGGTINDNTTTTKSVKFFDADLVADASHLIDNFSEIPASVNLNTYHSRLVMVGEFGTDETLQGLPPEITDNRSIARLSAPGEPEAISKVDGLIIAPLDGNPLTNVQEFRDVLYLFKRTRTFSYSDNFDVPATWQEEVLDQGIGAPVHGIAQVLDSGGVNTDFLLIADWSGLMLFNGVYSLPELSWKIEDYWRSLDRNFFHMVQLANDSINKKIWIVVPDNTRQILLHADYGDGINAKDIKWAKWKFDVQIRTIALIQTDRLIVGAPGPYNLPDPLGF